MSEPIDNVSNEGLVRVVHEEGFKFFYVNWTAFSMRDRVLRPYPFTASGVEWGVRLSSAHARSVVILTTIVTDVKEGTGVLQTRSVVIVIIAGHLARVPVSTGATWVVGRVSSSATSTTTIVATTPGAWVGRTICGRHEWCGLAWWSWWRVILGLLCRLEGINDALAEGTWGGKVVLNFLLAP